MHVKPERDRNNRDVYKRLWWQHVEARPAMHKAMRPLPRIITTVRVSKHRVFVWMCAPTLPDCATFIFARSDDYFFGVLHSRLHEVWALKLGTRLETRPRYTPTTCFETFPLPQLDSEPRPISEPRPLGSGQQPLVNARGSEANARGSELAQAIAAAAKELDALRNNWLNPPEWTKEEVLEFPGSVNGPWARYIVSSRDRQGAVNVGPLADARGSEIGLVRYPRLVPLDAECAAKLAKRTLTNLYNERPTWLDLAHKKLDAAVSAAYGWPADMSDEEILKRLLELNLARAEGNRQDAKKGKG
jgi:hypothetical protein